MTLHKQSKTEKEPESGSNSCEHKQREAENSCKEKNAQQMFLT